MASLTTGGAVAASAAAPLALRTLDSPGQSLTRPSVLGPALLGTGLVGAGYAVRNRMLAAPVGSRSGFSNLATLSGSAMLGGAVINALTATGQNTNIALPR